MPISDIPNLPEAVTLYPAYGPNSVNQGFLKEGFKKPFFQQPAFFENTSVSDPPACLRTLSRAQLQSSAAQGSLLLFRVEGLEFRGLGFRV